MRQPSEKLTKAQRSTATKALQEAIKKIGGPKKVGELCEVSGPAVSQWEITPDEHVLTIARGSGVSPTRLREDMYPKGTKIPGIPAEVAT